MQRCRCSTIALELFLQDFCSISLRQPSRPFATPLFKARNRISTSSGKQFTSTFSTYGPPRGLRQDVTSTRESSIPSGSESIVNSTAEPPQADGDNAVDTVRVESQDTSPDTVSAEEQGLDRTARRKQKKLNRLKEGTFKKHSQEMKRAQARQPDHEQQQPVEPLDKVIARANPPPDPTSKPPSPAPKNAKRTPPSPSDPPSVKTREEWQIQKSALATKFGETGWSPRKRLSPDTLAGIRRLHAADPVTYATPVLAAHFAVPAEAIRRILKSRWVPSAVEAEARERRWERRGERKWTALAALGVRPPVRWRRKGIKVEEERGKGGEGGERKGEKAERGEERVDGGMDGGKGKEGGGRREEKTVERRAREGRREERTVEGKRGERTVEGS